MLKCPYCYEEVAEQDNRCSHCAQFLIDDPVHVEFPSLDKKKCIFCGKKINQEAKYCLHCRKWLDEVDQTIDDIDWED